jgi:5,10-methylenetetrahydrofolate reductase
MNLQAKMLNPAVPVVLYEVIPPRTGPDGELESRLTLIREVAGNADAINIPEIREEARLGERRPRLRERVEPREFAQAIGAATKVETIVNRVTVHESPAEQQEWLREGCQKYGIRNLILVGGESNDAHYPGPSVTEMAAMAFGNRLPLLLGGITIAHREGEAERVRQKQAHGLRFFTTQVLLDSKDIVALIQELDGLQARILLSFTPVSNERDLEFLKGLGVEIPPSFREVIRSAGSPEEAVERSNLLARQILQEVFHSLPPQPPAIGIQVERITKRNSAAALRMLTDLGGFYRRLLRVRFAPAPETMEATTARSSPNSPRGRKIT